jgi:hypothetical protein
MSDLIPANFGALSTRFQGLAVQDDLSAGIQASFGLIGYKGKVWSVRYRGDERQLMREDGDGPKSSIEVVILAASSHVSKVWYEQGYVEGSTAAPDCFSNNGVAPDPASTKKQSDVCATCPMNAWGSRITPAGKAGKACADSKRLAVVPESDLTNEMFGGPMLLRVPAASLQDLASYGQKMQHMGYPYFAVATRIRFDPSESYPKFLFNAIRPLTDEQAGIVISHREGHAVSRILSENEYAASAAPAAAPAGVFEQPPAQAPQQAVKPAQQAQTGGFGAAKPVTTEGNAQKAPAKAAQVQQAPVETDEEREERELLARMEALKTKKAAAQAAAGNGSANVGTQQSANPDTSQANGTANHSTSGQTAQTNASPSSAPADDAFINSIDAELDKLLGSG